MQLQAVTGMKTSTQCLGAGGKKTQTMLGAIRKVAGQDMDLFICFSPLITRGYQMRIVDRVQSK